MAYFRAWMRAMRGAQLLANLHFVFNYLAKTANESAYVSTSAGRLSARRSRSFFLTTKAHVAFG